MGMNDFLYCESCGQQLEKPNARCGCHSIGIEYCPYCGTKYQEGRGEFWGAPCSEVMFDYAICHECGEILEA
jgi:hypothetical protein